jgi:uncharacterized membrane protein YvbJ
MKYCSHCGKELLDEAVVCPNCGCPVENYQQQNQTYNQQTYQSYSGLSIVGLIFSFISPLIGLILSIVANNIAKNEFDQKSAGLAKTGIIISAVLMAIEFVIAIIVVALVITGVMTGVMLA